MNQFMMLLRKDWRGNRVPILALALTALGSLAALVPFAFHATLLQTNPDRLGEYWQFVAGMTFFSIALTVILAPIFGGNAFASERMDRSADFLNTLPIPRLPIVFSKLIVALGSMLLAWLIYDGILCWASTGISGFEFGGFCSVSLALNLSMFGVAWMFSTFLESAAIAGAIAFALAIGNFLVVYFQITSVNGNWPRDGFVAWNCGLGILALVFGSIYYANRIEP